MLLSHLRKMDLNLGGLPFLSVFLLAQPTSLVLRLVFLSNENENQGGIVIRSVGLVFERPRFKSPLELWRLAE